MVKITGNVLVNTFKQYDYVRYLWGGSSPDTGWDCSGACNWVVGFKWHLAIPGFRPGAWGPGLGHGPVVEDWIQWIGVNKGVFGPVRPAPGDLIAWGPNVHMGMAVSATELISAENPNAGTRIDPIAGFFPWSPYVLRLLEVEIGTSTVSVGNPPGPGADDYSKTIYSSSNEVLQTSRNAQHYANGIVDVRRLWRH
jgi:cell wall-associated NlpC family hydrolase